MCIRDSTKEDKEDYTYSTYIHKQIPVTIDILNKSHGNSNQACITVGDTQSIILKDPPVSYTHLDVYKRQAKKYGYREVYIPTVHSLRECTITHVSKDVYQLSGTVEFP